VRGDAGDVGLHPSGRRAAPQHRTRRALLRPLLAAAAAGTGRGARIGGPLENEAAGGGGTEQGSPRAQERESDSCGQLQQQHDLLLREKEECRRLLEDLMRENEVKTIECRQAQESLHHMKMELMRESMHVVGSLASAVEGQVKEES
jgi:kinesin family member C2/C3